MKAVLIFLWMYSLVQILLSTDGSSNLTPRFKFQKQNLANLLGFVGQKRHLGLMPYGFDRGDLMKGRCENPRLVKPLKVFSGIVEQIGQIDSLDNNPNTKLWDGSVANGMELRISDASTVVNGTYIGASIAVNGVCLTVTNFSKDKFTAGIAPETMKKTNLKLLKRGNRVNLERSLRADGRNSGHYVQGHVDNTGEIVEFRSQDDSLWVRIKAPKDLMQYIVPKGYIAIDGTSLTVCEVDESKGTFTVMLVAHTQSNITLPKKTVGSLVNLEVDVMGKYASQKINLIKDRIDQLENDLVKLHHKVNALGKTTFESV